MPKHKGPRPTRAEKADSRKAKKIKREETLNRKYGRPISKRRMRDKEELERKAREEAGGGNDDGDTGFISLSGDTNENATVGAGETAEITHISGSNAPSESKKRKRDNHDDGHNGENQKEESSKPSTPAKVAEAPVRKKPKRNPLKYSKEGRAILKQQQAERLATTGRKYEIRKPQNSTEQNRKESEAPAAKEARFICFIGQLPKSATVESVKKHFSKIEPWSVRISTDKQTREGKGFGFIEFKDYDRMKTCLKLYHHSEFNDGISKPRKINVELTAGGGGSKSEVRKLRINEKNAKLTDERKRRRETEEKAKTDSEKKEERQGQKEDRKNKKGKNSNGDEKEAQFDVAENSEGIHPERLAQLQR